MKCGKVFKLIETWLRRLGFDEWWVVSFNVDVSDTWAETGQRVIAWELDLDELNRDVGIFVSIGIGSEDEYTINTDFDFEYIIVYSLLQVIHENDDCYCEMLHNKTATILGRWMTECVLAKDYSGRYPQKIC